jgi:uncharacterized protein
MSRLFKLFLHFFIVFLALSFALSAEVKFPAPQGFVNDFTNILTAEQKQELQSITSALKQTSGAELGVVVVQTVAPLDSKLYAVKLFEKWGLGEKGKDNGVLLLLALEERRVEIEVGYGLEGVINDALAGRILDTYAVPYFKQGEMGKGLVETAKAISQVVGGEEVPLTKAENTGVVTGGGTPFLIYVIVGVIILGLILRRGGSIIMGIMGAIWGSQYAGLFGAIVGALLGLFFGFWGFMFLGRGMGGGISRGGGGFGGFGGGRSGGGGSGRSW